MNNKYYVVDRANCGEEVEVETFATAASVGASRS